MPKVTIGLVQMKCSRDSQANLQKAVAGVRACAKRGAHIVSLSELFRSRYFCQGKNKKYFDLAEPIPGETTDVLGKVARELKVSIVASIFEKAAKGRFFNSTAVIGPDGAIIGKYRKVHIPSLPSGLYDENYYFSSGDLGFPAFQTPRAKVSALVCYDQWFPEAARISAANGAQILFYPTAIGWPAGAKASAGLPAGARKQRDALNKAEYEAWQITQRSHGIDNNIFVAVVNRVGVEGNLKFWGTSFVSDPYGRVLAKASSNSEENLVVTCDLSLIDAMRKEWPFLEERRTTLRIC
jgi:N-carbamoylputrescine amidase